jgi:2,3-bisphosphoglycerate-independent phosphoglycerate mutase
VPLILYAPQNAGRLGLADRPDAGLAQLAATAANLIGLEKHPDWQDSLLVVRA